MKVQDVLTNLEPFQLLNPAMSLQTVIAFLLVAEQEGRTVGEISEKLRLTRSAASRNLALWFDEATYGEPGYGLIRIAEDPRDRRNKRLYLTSKGRLFKERLERTS